MKTKYKFLCIEDLHIYITKISYINLNKNKSF